MTSNETTIEIPHNFLPREYQLPKFEAFDSGVKRGVSVWHRRSGKDTSDLNICIKKMLERVGGYYHLFPTAKQGRKVMWDGIDREGKSFMDYFPEELIYKKNLSEMKIELFNGSYYQIVGVDKSIDWIVGTNPVGLIFSEYSIMSPQVWDKMRPIIRENDGWALFNMTPRGENHGFKLYEMAKNNPKWFCSLLTIDNSKREDGSPIVSAEDIEEERKEGMSEEMIQQEYYCSFKASMPGSYFGKEISKAEKEGRVTSVPYDSGYEVDTWWDIGMDDSTTIWFTQTVGISIRCIDYYENSGEGVAHYATVLKDRGYNYGTHHFPHDGGNRSWSTGKDRKTTAMNLGLKPISVSERTSSKEDAIESARQIISKCYFDKDKCEHGLACLRNYRKEYNEKNRTFKMQPVHDWASHGADAFMELGMNYKDRIKIKERELEVVGGEHAWMG